MKKHPRIESSIAPTPSREPGPLPRDVQRACRRLVGQVPALREVLGKIKTREDWREHEPEIRLAIVQQSLADIARFEQQCRYWRVSAGQAGHFNEQKAALREAEREAKRHMAIGRCPGGGLSPMPVWEALRERLAKA